MLILSLMLMFIAGMLLGYIIGEQCGTSQLLQYFERKERRRKRECKHETNRPGKAKKTA